ncbi:Hypp962 [Branchiostoma lanceolatum]|uniref:Hypp962 protein n=1 Tax=Branchiostoma lanceolatum TaxID=7740 RepID=A0A8J9ZFA8_BRALA|nr:Hypp962 [Branchiostoma lanceolatum]
MAGELFSVEPDCLTETVHFLSSSVCCTGAFHDTCSALTPVLPEERPASARWRYSGRLVKHYSPWTRSWPFVIAGLGQG